MRNYRFLETSSEIKVWARGNSSQFLFFVVVVLCCSCPSPPPILLIWHLAKGIFLWGHFQINHNDNCEKWKPISVFPLANAAYNDVRITDFNFN